MCPNCKQQLTHSEYFDTDYCGWCGWYPKLSQEKIDAAHKKSKVWNTVALAVILVMVTGFIPVITGVIN